MVHVLLNKDKVLSRILDVNVYAVLEVDIVKGKIDRYGT
jgi:hypothetical protein